MVKFQRRNGCLWRKGLPVQHSTGKEILYSLFGINLSRSPPVSCPAQTNLPSQGEQGTNLHVLLIQGIFIPTRSLSLPHSICLSLPVICPFSSSCSHSLFLPAPLPSVSPLSKGYLAESYARGMFTVSLID